MLELLELLLKARGATFVIVGSTWQDLPIEAAGDEGAIPLVENCVPETLVAEGRGEGC